MALPSHLQKKEVESPKTQDSTMDPAKGDNPSRKERRKDWWKKKSANKEGLKSESPGDDTKDKGQRVKLRNRETIAKPDSLKYEHNASKGFNSKIMQTLNINTPSKSAKKRSAPQTPAKDTALSHATTKRKSSESQQPAASVSPSKKTKPEPQPEVFDSYKFSLGLINGEVDPKKQKDVKDPKKYVLFIGNLPFDITREQLEEHFRKTGGIKSIRIPREKTTDKGRGFAYMEFDGRISHGIALRLHQTTLGGRKINVEFTSIGGGKSEARKEKLKQKNIKRRKMKAH
ncbi:hypothetical protein EGW08_017581 [Elysia chlorotica]|uniref:RRM domain-containing protein n=1 Tax=Elysia chlorotica TaxID=188477 RepID=A0A3S1B471_ELYCH|nr:hypothetical protein EGW08_017581 [Elysia chlorotica]